MTTSGKSLSVSGGLAATLLLVVTSTPILADGWQGGRQGQWAGARGGYGTFQQRGAWRPGMQWRETRWQGTHGEGWGRLDRRWDTGQGWGYAERTYELPNGESWAARRQTVRNPDGTYTMSGTGVRGQPLGAWVSPDGNGNGYVGTYRGLGNGTQLETGRWIQRNPSGGYTQSGGYRTSDGRTGTISGQTQAIPDGYQRSTTVTNQSGQGYTTSVQVQNANGTTTRTTTVTGPGGQTYSYTTGVAVDPGG